MNKSRLTGFSSDPEALQNRVALRIAARLSEQTAHLGPDVGERLRFARERALQGAREARLRTRPAGSLSVGADGAAILGGDPSWWVRLGTALPLIALVAGLVLIQRSHVNAQITTAAEIDAVLLADDLPPTAYSDAGFVEFLKSPRR